MVRRPHRAQIGAAALAVLIGAVSTACGSLSGESHPTVPASPDSAAESWTIPPEQLACASDKLGYHLTQEQVDSDLGSGPAADAEADWEVQRWMRAHEQCLFETDDPDVDLSDPAWRATYRHAYALDENDDPTMDDPLAPWPGEENLPG